MVFSVFLLYYVLWLAHTATAIKVGPVYQSCARLGGADPSLTLDCRQPGSYIELQKIHVTECEGTASTTGCCDAGSGDIKFSDPGDAMFQDSPEASFQEPGEAMFPDPGEAMFQDPGEAMFTDPGEAMFQDTGEASFQDQVKAIADWSTSCDQQIRCSLNLGDLDIRVTKAASLQAMYTCRSHSQDGSKGVEALNEELRLFEAGFRQVYTTTTELDTTTTAFTTPTSEPDTTRHAFIVTTSEPDTTRHAFTTTTSEPDTTTHAFTTTTSEPDTTTHAFIITTSELDTTTHEFITTTSEPDTTTHAFITTTSAPDTITHAFATTNSQQDITTHAFATTNFQQDITTHAFATTNSQQETTTHAFVAATTRSPTSTTPVYAITTAKTTVQSDGHDEQSNLGLYLGVGIAIAVILMAGLIAGLIYLKRKQSSTPHTPPSPPDGPSSPSEYNSLEPGAGSRAPVFTEYQTLFHGDGVSNPGTQPQASPTPRGQVETPYVELDAVIAHEPAIAAFAQPVFERRRNPQEEPNIEYQNAEFVEMVSKGNRAKNKMAVGPSEYQNAEMVQRMAMATAPNPTGGQFTQDPGADITLEADVETALYENSPRPWHGSPAVDRHDGEKKQHRQAQEPDSGAGYPTHGHDAILGASGVPPEEVLGRLGDVTGMARSAPVVGDPGTGVRAGQIHTGVAGSHLTHKSKETQFAPPVGCHGAPGAKHIYINM